MQKRSRLWPRLTQTTLQVRVIRRKIRSAEALDAANVTFHAIDPHGLDPNEGISFRQQSLAVLPDYTGGRTVIDNNKPETKIGPIFEESRSYYVLAVARDLAASKDDDQHKIRITVKRSDATVHARNLYFAADSKDAAKRAPNAAAGALNELLPGGDFSLQMNLVPQFTQDGSAEIRVLLGVESAVAGKLDVPAAALVGSSEFQWTSVLKPPPGDYEVRAAVATADGKHAANVIGYVDVPDVDKQGFAFSGIVVQVGGAATVLRQFGAGSTIGLSFQVARAKNTTGTATVRYTLRDDVGQERANIEVPHERAIPVAPGVDGFNIGVRLPTRAGRYVVSIDASDGRRAARREVPLTIR